MGLEGLCAGEGDVTGSPGEREGTEGVSGAGREAEEGEEGLGIGLGLPAAGLVATGDGLMAADVNAFTGLGAVGGPRGLGDTGGGTRCLGSVQTKKITLFFCYCTVRLSGNISAGFTSTKSLWGVPVHVSPGLCAVSVVSGPGMGTRRVGVGGSAWLFLRLTVDGLGETGGFSDFLASSHSQVSLPCSVLSEASDTGLLLSTRPPFCCTSLPVSGWLLL